MRTHAHARFTKGEPNHGLIRLLNEEGVKVNVTAVFTQNQTYNVLESVVNNETPIIISIFAGRIAGQHICVRAGI